MIVGPIVIDASIALAQLRDEVATPNVRAALAEWVRDRRAIAVPSHFWLEVVNALARGKRLPGRLVLEAIHELDELGIASVDVDRALLVLTIDRVERHGLTAYDAAYLALTDSLGGHLATVDRRLAAAAGSSAIYLGPDPPPRRLSEDREPYGAEPTWPDFAGASAYLARLRAESRKARTIG